VQGRGGPPVPAPLKPRKTHPEIGATCCQINVVVGCFWITREYDCPCNQFIQREKNGFQDRRNRPLYHPSFLITINQFRDPVTDEFLWICFRHQTEKDFFKDNPYSKMTNQKMAQLRPITDSRGPASSGITTGKVPGAFISPSQTLTAAFWHAGSGLYASTMLGRCGNS